MCCARRCSGSWPNGSAPTRWGSAIDALAAHTTIALDAPSQARRRLKRRVLELLELGDADQARQLAAAQYREAPGMTDRLAALAVLVRGASARGRQRRWRTIASATPATRWRWTSGLPCRRRRRASRRCHACMRLEKDPAFTLHNPNRVHSLLGAFVRGNPSGFHRLDGAGYRFLTERLATLDALNPQLAARLATAFNGWQRLEPGRRAQAQAAIMELAGHAGLSRNLAEIIDNVLNH